MSNRLIDRIRARMAASSRPPRPSYLRSLISGSFFKMSDLRGSSTISDIKTRIETMRALANDSQISTALSYYATDATTANTAGQIIWATSETEEVANIINDLFKKWKINLYVRDHILELATIGNLYVPTTDMYKELSRVRQHSGVALDNNTIPSADFDIIPSYKIPPEDIIHIWLEGKAKGYIYQPEDKLQEYITYPESAVIHFSLGGLLGDYTIKTLMPSGEEQDWDIMFAEPLMSNAVAPTQTLSLLEDAIILSSMIRVVRFVNVDCGNAEEEEVQNILQQMKDAIEQQLSLHTGSGDTQSFVNPQSPNNLIYIPKVNGQEAVSITDLDMTAASEADNSLLTHYQDKKLSVLGVPKEALNFSSNEGLGGAGSVMSQRSALYANILNRLETAYKVGWTDGLNMYFSQHGMSGFCDKFELHMNPIITMQSTIQFEKRDAALSQASTLIDVLKSVGVTKDSVYLNSLIEILSEVFPQMGAEATNWNIHVDDGSNAGGANDEF